MRKPDDLCTFLSTLKTKYNALSVVIVRYLLQHNAVLPSTCEGAYMEKIHVTCQPCTKHIIRCSHFTLLDSTWDLALTGLMLHDN